MSHTFFGFILHYKTMTLPLPLSLLCSSSIFFFCNFSKACFCIIFPLGNSILTFSFVGKIFVASYIAVDVVKRRIAPGRPIYPQGPCYFLLNKIFGSLFFLYFCSRKELLGSKRMQIAEFRTIAKSLPLLR